MDDAYLLTFEVVLHLHMLYKMYGLKKKLEIRKITEITEKQRIVLKQVIIMNLNLSENSLCTSQKRNNIETTCLYIVFSISIDVSMIDFTKTLQ